MKINVFLVDDHSFVREGLKSVINKENDMCVVGEAANGSKVIDKIKKLNVDIIIMDVEMPELDGIETTKLLSSNSNVKILALSAHSEIHYVQKMLKAGAKGYLLKECVLEELPRAIRKIFNSGIFISDKLTNDVVSDYVKKLYQAESGPLALLTPKEIEVITLIVKGVPRNQIARKLYTTPSTISKHRQNAMEKLGISTNADLVVFAVKEGIISLD